MSNDKVFGELTRSLQTALESGEVVRYAGRFRFETPNKMFAGPFKQSGALVVVTDQRVIVEAEGVTGWIPRRSIGEATVDGGRASRKATVSLTGSMPESPLLALALQADRGHVVIGAPISGALDELLAAMGIALATGSAPAVSTVPPVASTRPPTAVPTRPASPQTPQQPAVSPSVPAPPVSSPQTQSTVPSAAPFVAPVIPGFNMPTRKRSGVVKVLIGASALAVVAVVAVTFLGKSASAKFSSAGVAIGDGGSANRTSTTTSRAGFTTTTNSSLSETTSTTIATTSTVSPQTFTVINAGTCEGKPCHISLRDTPNDNLSVTFTDPARSRVNGNRVTVVCQAPGQPVTDPQTHEKSFVWDKLDNDKFMSDVYLDTPTNRGVVSNLPVC